MQATTTRPLEPIPVHEDSPGPRDCDDYGRCWWGCEDDGRWAWCWAMAPVDGQTHWLPASSRYLPAMIE